MSLFIKGIILGCIMVMPGMSGGTAFLILGLYEDMVKDLVKLNVKPYLPLIGGILTGIFISGSIFAFVFENYKDATVSFLLGALLASTKSVLKGTSKVNLKYLAVLIVGTMVGLLVVGEPLSLNSSTTEEVGFLALFIGGALATAAMIIPGVPGSSVLILMGIYDVMFISIKELDMRNLFIFGIGAVAGSVLLLNLLAKLYEKYKSMLSYFFAGLILGSARSMIPSSISPVTLGLALGAFVLVWYWSSKEDGQPLPGQA